MKPPPLHFRRVRLLVPLHDRFSLPENPAGACGKDKSFFAIYKIFFQRKRIYRPITFSINFDRLAKQVSQGVAKFRKCSLKVGYCGVCYWVGNNGNIVFILNIKQRLCNYKMNILFIRLFYFSHVNRFF